MPGPEGDVISDGIRIRERLKGTHRIVLPSASGPVRAPAWLHFSPPTELPPSYSIVEVLIPDRAIRSKKIAGIWLRPLGLPVATIECFGDPMKVDNWIQEQRGRRPKTKSAVDVWEYYRSCGIEAGPAACAAAGVPPLHAWCIRCKEMIGPNGCVNENCCERVAFG